MLKKKIDNPRYPHRIRIVRKQVSACINPYKDDDEEEVVLYDGVGRSYTDTTTTGDKRVDYNKRKVVVPVRFDGWAEGRYPLDGDLIEVEIGNIKEQGVVNDFEGDNGRSVVYWQFTRN